MKYELYQIKWFLFDGFIVQGYIIEIKQFLVGEQVSYELTLRNGRVGIFTFPENEIYNTKEEAAEIKVVYLTLFENINE